MKINQNNSGLAAEKLAATFSMSHGLKLVTQNYHCRFGEVDLIMMEAKTLVFVEVKTRTDIVFDKPENAVDGKKQRLMTQAAIAYMAESGHEWAIRFDIVSIILRGGIFYFDHFEDAFFPGLA